MPGFLDQFSGPLPYRSKRDNEAGREECIRSATAVASGNGLPAAFFDVHADTVDSLRASGRKYWPHGPLRE